MHCSLSSRYVVCLITAAVKSEYNLSLSLRLSNMVANWLKFDSHLNLDSWRAVQAGVPQVSE